jgi:hypothetical protein
MNVLSARIDRFLIAGALGLAIAIIGALSIEQSPSAAIARGDFPAFYTMATLASRGEGARLYDLEAQRQVQNELWPSLDGSVLPVAYPAFLAFFIEPLAMIPPSNARLVWVCGMVMCVVVAGWLLARSSSFLRGLTWQVMVTSLLFAPLFVGVLGGQIVGLSVLLYAAILFLDRQKRKEMEIPLGVITGLWMYKPHFALAVVVVLLARGRWLAVGAWCVTCVALWSLGVLVAGLGWLSEWLAFANGFVHIDLITNAPRMTGVVPFLYVLSDWFHADWIGRIEVWAALTVVSALVVPLALTLLARRGSPPNANLSLLAVGPLLVLFAPAVNFYDLSLAVLPLLLMLRPSRRVDRAIAVGVLALGQLGILLKDRGVAGVFFVSGAFLVYLLLNASIRERKEIASTREG